MAQRTSSLKSTLPILVIANFVLVAAQATETQIEEALHPQRGGEPPDFDPEGSSPGNAIVIVPDGATFAGAIDFGGDVDWFTFRAGAGITYTLQIFGFPPDPFFPLEEDLTGLGDFALRAQIVSFNGVDQIANSTGTAGGTEYDIDMAPVTTGEGSVTLGDSRIVWVAPTTNDYFIRIRHERVLTGRGHYVFNLASSQLGTTDTGRMQTGKRDLTLFNGEELVFDGTVEGGIGIFNWDYPNNDASISSFVSSVFFLDGGIPEDTPQTPAFHIHWGIPDIFEPQFSLNFQDCGADPHCWAYDFGAPPVVPADFPPEVVRLITGGPWYVDVHVTDDFDILPTPIAVSLPNGDIYSLFESELAMSQSNVVRESDLSETVRGANPDFTLFYDTALKTLQIARRTFDPVSGGGIVPADAESYAGDILTVYARGAGGSDPIVPPSVISAPKDPPDFLELFFGQMDPGPGFRNVIRQLSDAEAEALRDAYYDTGIYFEVTDMITGQPIARADAAPLTPGVPSLEIQDVPLTLEIVYVDFVTGSPTGTGVESDPVDSLGVALTIVEVAGVMMINTGSTTETITIDQAVTIEAVNGTVRIGEPGGRNSENRQQSGFVSRD